MTKTPDCEIWFEQGMGYQEQENYAQALDCFQKAIHSNPHFILAWVYKGIALKQLEDYEAAIRCYEQAIKINPDVADLWYNKGASFCHFHRFQEGLACFNRVLELDPHHAICQTARTLTLATIPNPIKLPKRKNLDSERNPLETEESIRLSLTEENQVFGKISNEELEPE